MPLASCEHSWLRTATFQDDGDVTGSALTLALLSEIRASQCGESCRWWGLWWQRLADESPYSKGADFEMGCDSRHLFENSEVLSAFFAVKAIIVGDVSRGAFREGDYCLSGDSRLVGHPQKSRCLPRHIRCAAERSVGNKAAYQRFSELSVCVHAVRSKKKTPKAPWCCSHPRSSANGSTPALLLDPIFPSFICVSSTNE